LIFFSSQKIGKILPIFGILFENTCFAIVTFSVKIKKIEGNFMQLKLLRIFVFILILGGFCLGWGYFAFAKSWDFEKWVSDITINPDATFLVREMQTVNFSGSFTWLKRDIAIKRFKKISNIAVYDENGRRLSGNEVEISRGIGNVSVKINMQATDEQRTWTIEYKISGGIGFFKDYDELYWNAISGTRDVPIKSVEVFVHLPQKVAKDQLRQKLFIGAARSQNESRDFEILEDDTLHYQGQDIAPYTDFTIVAGWPRGIVHQDWWTIISPYFWILIPIITFILLFLKWWKSGRDPKMKGTVIPQYEPPKEMTPGEMGVLIREKMEVKDISATLVDLARRGYLKILEQEKHNFISSSKTYNFILQKRFQSDTNLKEHEKLILSNIFSSGEEVSLDDLKNNFYRHIPSIDNVISQEVTMDGYFTQDPEKEVKKYVAFGVFLLFLGGFLLFYFHQIMAGIVISLSGILVIIFGHFMPARTAKGTEVKWQTLGFKMFLSVAERFHLKANVDPRMFEKYLSFAMVLGVEKQWADRFADIYIEPPDWYVPLAGWTAFSLGDFSDNLSSMSNSFSSVLSSSPSSSSGFGGGGFAGGGGGGGGSSAG